MNANGDNGPNPEHLAKLQSQLKGFARECRRSIRKRRNRVYVGKEAPQIPRQICTICQTAFDFVSQTNPTPPQKSICADCKEKLVTQAALFSKTYHAWITPTHLFLAGKYYEITDATMEIIKKRFKEQVNGKDAATET